MKHLLQRIQENLKNEDGLATIEIVLIIVISIAVVLIFKEQIMDLVENIMDKITKQAMRV